MTKLFGTPMASPYWRRIAFGMRAKGSVVIDDGAKDAITEKGKSLLAVGVVEVRGRFNKGDTLKVYSLDGQLLAKGISNFSDKELKKVKGKNEKQISEQLGTSLCSEIIHRDCLVVFKS
ncbi:MAG: PUA domain-containing protein [Armatimonadota bacterium]